MATRKKKATKKKTSKRKTTKKKITKKKKKVKETASQMAPAQIAKNVATKARKRSRLVADALREGRQVMNDHEDELRARREGRFVSLEDHVEPGDQVFVDGQPVESGRVIVMRQRDR